MKRTISVRLETTQEQNKKLQNLQEAFLIACNQIVPHVVENRCWNRISLHNLVYTKIRKNSPLGSQMVCNAIFSVCKAYKNKLISKAGDLPTIHFHKNRSIHFDKRTYSMRANTLSLYTLEGRIRVEMRFGSFQQQLFNQGVPKEAELICKKGYWYLNLVLDLSDPPLSENQTIFAVDLGENTLAATSSGKLFGGSKIRHERDKYLAKRRRLQSNGTQSAKQLLKKVSGKEARRMKQVNHEVSKEIIKEALENKAGVLVLENLTNIRSRIRANKRLRTRLHRWAFRQLQTFIEYKAEAKGLRVVYVDPSYSSQLCSFCDALGNRQGLVFTCTCGNKQHSDLNASRNLCKFGLSIGGPTCEVNRTQVAAKR